MEKVFNFALGIAVAFVFAMAVGLIVKPHIIDMMNDHTYFKTCEWAVEQYGSDNFEIRPMVTVDGLVKSYMVDIHHSNDYATVKYYQH